MRSPCLILTITITIATEGMAPRPQDILVWVVARAEIRFCVAGLEVCLRAARAGELDSLSGFYGQYPSSGAAPDLIVDIERIPGFARGRERGPEYPAFRRTRTGPRTVSLSRFDAEGEIALPPADSNDAIHARFRVGESTNTLEAAVRIGASIALPRRGGFIMHASGIAARHRALLFAGVSGAGKSTIATLISGASPAFTRISDELVIVMPDHNGTFAAYITPFIGSEGLPHGTSVPLAGLHFLAQASHHRRTPMARADAVRELMRHVLAYVAEPITAARILAAASRCARAVPCYRLAFAKNPGVVGVLDLT